jgi:hypothetical protein
MRSPEELRQNLAQTVLNVRSGRATSRRKLADVMHLSPTTSGYYVDQLIASGHLYESGFEQGGKGRPKRSLEAAAGAGWFAGVEFNAERIQTVCIDFSGSLVAKDQLRLPTDADARQVMAALVDNRRAHSIYSQNLENFNYYDTMPQNNLGQPGPSVAAPTPNPTTPNKPQ